MTALLVMVGAAGPVLPGAARAADVGTAIVAHKTSGPDAARMTARRYWHLEDVCRGASDPAVWRPACRARDRFLRAQGLRTAKRFHQAWRRGDRPAMRHLVEQDWVLAMFPGRASRRRIDCEHDRDDGTWFCWMRARRGSWVGVRLEVTRYARPRLPRWQVVGAAPDCC